MPPRPNHRPDPLLIVSRSARSLAVSAARGGYAVDVVDACADTETSAAAGLCLVAAADDDGFLPDSLRTAMDAYRRRRNGDFAILPGSGFEARTGLLEMLQRYAPLLGNDRRVVHRVKDPIRFFAVLDELGIAHPAVSLQAPRDRGWLLKPVGGTGGMGIRRWQPGDNVAVGTVVYWQQEIHGQAASVVFLANGKDCRVAGFNQCWTAGRGDWRFSRIVRWQPPTGLAKAMQQALTALVRAFELRGLCGMDFIIHSNGFQVLEINPRPPASFDLHEHGRSLVAAHLVAMKGDLPDDLPVVASCPGKQVIYAPSDTRLPVDFDWPAWCLDRPVLPIRLEPGAPVCTITATADTVAACDKVLQQRENYLINKFNIIQ